MEINEKEFESIWRALDTRISTLNDRTKRHTIDIRELRQQIRLLLKKCA